MTAALALITLGFLMVLSALRGVSIVEVLEGKKGNPLDSQGGAPPDPSSAGTMLLGSGATGNTLGQLPGPSNFYGPHADTLTTLAAVAVHQFHLTLSSVCRSAADNARAGGADHSNHLINAEGKCKAFDASGNPVDMGAFFDYVAENYRHDITELFYDPRGAIKNGFTIPAIGGHDDHVHVGG